jgi:hypothetical protein
MPQYRVRVRGSFDLGEQTLGDLQNLHELKRFGPTTVKANSANMAAADALAHLPRDRWLVDLVYVYDDSGGAQVFWPTGEPLTYVRRRGEFFAAETGCFLSVAEECQGRGSPETDAVFVEDYQGGWVCESCAAIVAPGV